MSATGDASSTSAAVSPIGRVEFPSVFVVGCPRSGTTLLQRMLDNHRLLTVANDTHFIPRVLEKEQPQSVAAALSGEPISLSRRLVEGVRTYHRSRRLELPADAFEFAARDAETYAEFVSALYAERAERAGKRYSGEKTPDYVRHLPLLARLFPEASVLHIVRDGRDVGLSLLDWANATKGPGKLALWERRPVAVAALWWKWLVRAGIEGAASVAPERYAIIRYEQLVAAPEEPLRRAVDAIGIPYDESMLRFYEGKSRPVSGGSAKKSWLPPTAGLRDWATQLRPDDLQLFELLAGDLLEELGYPLSGQRPDAATVEVANSCRDWFHAHFHPSGPSVATSP